MTANIQLIHDLDRAEMSKACEEMGLPSFRADQVYRWLYVQGVHAWSDMTNIPLSQRSDLSEKYSMDSAAAIEVTGEEGKTRKILVGLRDGECVEQVLIPGGNRRTVCVSSQVGCSHDCTFCASGQGGLRRSLDTGEMVGQVLLARRVYNEKPTHVVFMGIGEPFDNYDAVVKAARIINDPQGLGVGARRITISTCGIVPGIKRLSEEGIQLELSISLHSADDEIRSRLMPVNRKYPLAELMEACREYSEKTNRLITFEYILIRDVNDQPLHARQLSDLLGSFPARVNLIPLSEVAEYDGSPSGKESAGMFVDALYKAGINATLRASKGSRVRAACGQLRLSRS